MIKSKSKREASIKEKFPDPFMVSEYQNFNNQSSGRREDKGEYPATKKVRDSGSLDPMRQKSMTL